MAKASAASRALARVKNLTIENESIRKAGRSAVAAATSNAGQTVAISVAAGVGGTYAGYKAEEWIHDPERGYAADSIMLVGVGGIPVTTLAGAGVAALGIMRIWKRKGKLKANAAIASLGAGIAGGGYLYKLSTETP